MGGLTDKEWPETSGLFECMHCLKRAVVWDRYCKDCDNRKGIKDDKYGIIYEIGEAPCGACEADDMFYELENAPTVDAEPVRHGHWELSPFDGNWTCSNCGNKPYHSNMKNMNYCPNCGAKMDEVEDGKID